MIKSSSLRSGLGSEKDAACVYKINYGLRFITLPISLLLRRLYLQDV